MAEREDANSLSDQHPQSSDSKRQHDPTAGIRSQGINPPVLPFLGQKRFQKSDPELGGCDVSTRPSALRSYPKFAAFLDSGETFMVHERFSWLHARVLLCDNLERRPDELDEISRQREESTSHKSRDWLLKAIEEKLSDYSKQRLRD